MVEIEWRLILLFFVFFFVLCVSCFFVTSNRLKDFFFFPIDMEAGVIRASQITVPHVGQIDQIDLDLDRLDPNLPL